MRSLRPLPQWEIIRECACRRTRERLFLQELAPPYYWVKTASSHNLRKSVGRSPQRCGTFLIRGGGNARTSLNKHSCLYRRSWMEDVLSLICSPSPSLIGATNVLFAAMMESLKTIKTFFRLQSPIGLDNTNLPQRLTFCAFCWKSLFGSIIEMATG